MNAILLLTFLLISFTIFTACSGDKESAHSGKTSAAEKHEIEPGHEQHAAVDPLYELKLNEGEKWVMDAHTRTMFARMDSVFNTSDHSTLAGLNTAGRQLQGLVGELVKGCTMQGAAHDQLHVFLSGYIPAVGSLASAGEVKDGRELAKKIKLYLSKYPAYFK